MWIITQNNGKTWSSPVCGLDFTHYQYGANFLLLGKKDPQTTGASSFFFFFYGKTRIHGFLTHTEW